MTVSADSLIYGLSNGQQGFASPRTVLALGAAMLLAGVFVLVERVTPSPMVPFRYFSSPTHHATRWPPTGARAISCSPACMAERRKSASVNSGLAPSST